MSDTKRKKWCRSGKVRYENEAAARSSEDEVARKFGFAMTSYECACGWWHHRKAKYRGTNIPRKL